MVFQNYALYPHMTIRGEPRVRAEDAKDAARRDATGCVDEAAGVLEHAGDLLDASRGSSPAASGSGSPLGRALVRAPGRCSSSTSPSRISTRSCASRCAAEIKKLQQRLGTTAIYVTHDQIEAMTMGARIAVMQRRPDPAGRGAARDLPAARQPLRRQLHRQPADELPAGPASSGTERPLASGLRAVASAGGRPRPSPGEDGRAGRSRNPSRERRRRRGGGRRDRRSRSPSRSSSSSPLGDEVIVHGRVGEEALLCKLAPARACRRPAAASSRRDRAREMHVFDAETELRMTA